MSANAGRYKSNLGERIAIYQEHTVGHHVSHIEHLAIGREGMSPGIPLVERFKTPNTFGTSVSIFTREPSNSQVKIA